MYEGRSQVAICLPMQDEVKAEFTLSLASLTYCTKERIALIRGSSSIVATARNLCLDQMFTVEDMTKSRFDYIFMIDSDMVFPADALGRLMKHDLPIVAATYIRRTPPFDLMSKLIDDKPVEVESGLVEVLGLPTGMMLIKREVFDHFKRPIFRFTFDEEKGEIGGEDLLFCSQARGFGYGVFVDVDLTKEIGHVGVHVFRPYEGNVPATDFNKVGFVNPDGSKLNGERAHV